jgi:hypothetical protein
MPRRLGVSVTRARTDRIDMQNRRSTNKSALVPILVFALFGLSMSTFASCSGGKLHGCPEAGGSVCDDQSDAGSDGGGPLQCTESVALFCVDHACVKSWGNVATQSCATIGGRLIRMSPMPCDGFDVLVSSGTDTGTSYYYESASGNLVAVVDYSANTGSNYCVAGPASFAPPECSLSFTSLTCDHDGGP